MAPLQSATEVREAVGVFLDERSYQQAIDELLMSGFDHADISVLAAESTIQQKLANTYAQTTDLADTGEHEVERRHYVATESVGNAKGAIIGGLVYVGAMVAAGPVIVAAGGVIGSVLSSWLGTSEGDHLQVQLENGGLLLWVHTRDEAHESLAVSIMKKHSGQDVHLHAIPIQRERAQKAQFNFQPPLSVKEGAGR